MVNKEKNFDEQYIIELLNNMEKEGITEKEKLICLRKIIKYFNRKIKYYKDTGMDVSVGMLFVGTGIGNRIGESDNISLSVALCTIGIGSMVFSSIKRNIKYNNAINNLKKEDIKSPKKKI